MVRINYLILSSVFSLLGMRARLCVEPLCGQSLRAIPPLVDSCKKTNFRYDFKDELQCLLLIKYFCPVRQEIFFCGTVPLPYEAPVKALLPWLQTRVEELVRANTVNPLPAGNDWRWIGFEEFSESDIRCIDLAQSAKKVDLYTGDMIIFQVLPNDKEQVPSEKLELLPNPSESVYTVAELACNRANKMSLKVVFMTPEVQLTIDGVGSDPSTMHNSGSSTRLSPTEEDPAESQKIRSKEFSADLRHTIKDSVSKIGSHFGCDPAQIWLFQKPPASVPDDPFPRDSLNMRWADSKLGSQLILFAIDMGKPFRTEESTRCATLVRFFNESVSETATRVLENISPSHTVQDIVAMAVESFFGNQEKASNYRLLKFAADGKNCEPYTDNSPWDSILNMRSRNVVFDSLRLERKPQDTQVTEICCFHAERANAASFGHPFMLSIHATDSGVDLKNRIRDKLNLPESQFKHFRIAKCTLASEQSFEAGRNLIKDEDTPETLQDFLFQTRSARLCLEHPHPSVSAPSYFGEAKTRLRPQAQLTIK